MHFCQNSIVKTLRVVKHVGSGSMGAVTTMRETPTAPVTCQLHCVCDVGTSFWRDIIYQRDSTKKSNSSVAKHSTHYVRWCKETTVKNVNFWTF